MSLSTALSKLCACAIVSHWSYYVSIYRRSSFRQHSSGVILVAAFCFLSSPALYAVQPAAPQLLPYTVSVVAGGGTYGVTANKYTVGNYCGTNTSSPPAGTPPAPLTSWPTALSTVGDGCLATQVAITSPNAAAVDSEGNVFIVDYTNKLIRRVDAHTGIITTVAERHDRDHHASCD